MIRFDNVTKDYDGTTAVNGLDLSVEDGELFVFLGPPSCWTDCPCRPNTASGPCRRCSSSTVGG
jgi:hypothetical protein